MGISFVLTVLLELVIAKIFRLNGKDTALTVVANLLTNPAVNAAYHIASGILPICGIWIKLPLEAAAVIAEWQVYKRFGDKIDKPFMLSLSANCFSFTVGVLLNIILR